MKFRTLFIIFNVLIAVFLVFLLTVPVAVLGPETARSFFRSAWPLALALILCALGLNVFFLLNVKLYTLLERGDWPALAGWLEEEVMVRGRHGARFVAVLANTWLVLSAFPALRGLEERLAREKPALLADLALVFGAGRLLSGDHAGAEKFFTEHGAARKTDPWLRFYRAFSLLFLRQDRGAAPASRAEPAAEIFTALAQSSRAPLVTGLSAFFLDRETGTDTAPPSRTAAARAGRERTRKKLRNRAAWNRAVSRHGEDVHVAILSKYLGEAADWIYAAGEKNGAQL